MNEERVGDIVLHGNDAIRLAYMLYRPTEEELLYNRSVLERIDNNITITELSLIHISEPTRPY